MSFLNEELCQSTVIQSSEMFDQIVFTAQDLSCNEYTPFIALYVAIAAFKVLLKLRYFLNIQNN